jgi:hypothetical protein
MALRDWKLSKHHARTNTRIAWESIEGNTLSIDYDKSYSIPYRLILNDYKTIDSTNAFVRIKKLATNYMRKHQ